MILKENILFYILILKRKIKMIFLQDLTNFQASR